MGSKKGGKPKNPVPVSEAPGGQQRPAVASKEAEQPRKRAKSEIDDIFLAKKHKPAEKAAEDPGDEARTSGQAAELEELEKQIREAREKAKGKQPAVVGSKDDIFGVTTGRRKRTGDGLALYSEKELGLDRKGGGDTDLCPFDCDCCF